MFIWNKPKTESPEKDLEELKSLREQLESVTHSLRQTTNRLKTKVDTVVVVK